MYYYLYDSFLNDKKYEKVLDQIKTRLLDLDIQGKHERLSMLKNIESLVNTEVKRGAKTIVLVGNDRSFLKAVDAVAKHDVTIGIIPVGNDNLLAEAFGMPHEEAACEVLAARKIATFDLGQANNIYFFSNLSVKKNIGRIAISHQGYKVVPKPQCTEVGIYNFFVPPGKSYDKQLDKINPRDVAIDLVIKSEEQSHGLKRLFSKQRRERVDSILQGKNFEIKSFEYLPLMLDDYKIMKTPVSVRVADKKLKVIVGRTQKEWL